MRSIERYGWRRNLPDHRDFKLSPPSFIDIPPIIDLSLNPDEPPIYDQSQAGTCTANGVGALFEADLIKQGLTDFMPSRLFLYFNSGVIEGSQNQDNGRQPRDVFDTLAKLGVCPEVDWPYDLSKNLGVKPPDECYQAAKGNNATNYFSIPRSLEQLFACLASGFRFGFGISVFDSFESEEVARTGIVPMPSMSESSLGGHFVVGCGKDDTRKAFKCRNSWGPGWGLKGYFYLPYDYIMDQELGSDFTTLRKVA